MFLADHFCLRIDGLDGSKYSGDEFRCQITNAHELTRFINGNKSRLRRVLTLEQNIFTRAQMAIEFLVVAVQVMAYAIPFGLLHTEGFDVAHLVGTVIVVRTELVRLIMATELFLFLYIHIVRSKIECKGTTNF